MKFMVQIVSLVEIVKCLRNAEKQLLFHLAPKLYNSVSTDHSTPNSKSFQGFKIMVRPMGEEKFIILR